MHKSNHPKRIKRSQILFICVIGALLALLFFTNKHAVTPGGVPSQTGEREAVILDIGIEEFPAVRIQGQSEQKFIIARISAGGKSKRIFFGGMVGWHYELLHELLRSGFSVAVDGGGRVEIDAEAKTVYLFDRSNSYGPFDFEEAKKMLADEYPDFTFVAGEKPGTTTPLRI